jgi:pilus assembly protein CpaB
MAMTLLEDVIVIATGEYTGENFKSATKDKKGQISYSDITVYVLPQEAEILILSQNLGTLYLSLRNPEDLSPSSQKGRVTLDTIFTGDRTMELKEIRQKTLQKVKIIKGGGQ